jgi:hypothetical protein
VQIAIQRVIQTDLFLKPTDIKWKFPELVFNTPGISMAFFRGNSTQVKWHEVISTIPTGKAPKASRNFCTCPRKRSLRTLATSCPTMPP